MKRLIPLILLAGCATTQKRIDTSWVFAWNSATNVVARERAVEMMEHSDYIRYNEQILRHYVNGSYANIPVYDVEREVVYFHMAVQYLSEYQTTGKSFDKAQVYSRKLLELDDLHPFSKFLVGRVQELTGGDYNKTYIPIPRGEKKWNFTIGYLSNTATVNFGNLSSEYDRILSAKKGGILGTGSQAACAASLLCFFAIAGNNEITIDDLKETILLFVEDAFGNHVSLLGSSPWLATGK